ncbi:MAG: hypothetical protein [Wendovervirus sonii]|uniref:Baseplate wedge subunit n=1 Tax=phage Lak_Megaphage_Sonny TaxID=3109229 RepID=A0ABZ0Z5I2_9CAUD|nr:MAG: hypothetical protein [phage Lak_Megaphage_Sonny]
MIDIYNRLATDQQYNPLLETEDEFDYILQQIKMILGTNKGDVLGSPYFGLNIKRYIFSMSYNREELNSLIKMAILPNIDYDQSKYDVDIDVEFGKNKQDNYDYAVLNISINQKRCLGIMVTQ